MKKVLTILLTLAVILLSSCGAEPLPDAYVAGSDYQYTQWSSYLSYPNLQQGDGGIYLFHRGFLYYLAEGTDRIMPLCNKADCLHDQETSLEKMVECNAFMGTDEDIRIMQTSENAWEWYWDDGGIALCNGYLYYLSDAASQLVPQTLCRCALDGTGKETVYTWNREEGQVLEWIIHRDVLYYVEKSYYVKDEEEEEIIEINSLKALPLTGLIRRPSVLYTWDEAWTVYSLGSFQAYGNYVYATILAKRSADGASESQSYNGMLVYDIQKKSLDMLELPGLPESASVNRIQFWQDKLILNPYDGAEEGDALMPVYLAELDGSNPEVLLEGVPQAGYFLSDGEYLYFFYDWMPDIDDWLSNPGSYTVYDKDLNIVDTYTAPLVPNNKFERLPVGGADVMYFQFEGDEDGSWGVLRWDKSGLGSYNGQEIALTEIWR